MTVSLQGMGNGQGIVKVRRRQGFALQDRRQKIRRHITSLGQILGHEGQDLLGTIGLQVLIEEA